MPVRYGDSFLKGFPDFAAATADEEWLMKAL
jgi:hypothetical protein